MGVFTPDLDTMRELYVLTLQRTLSSEKQIVDALPKMIEKSTSTELAKAFREHLAESEQHVSRLNTILSSQGKDSDSKCKITAAIISGAESEISDAGNDQIRDVVLIAGGNQIEHHEIAVYGTLRTWAEVLGDDRAVPLLEKTLKEEKHADEVLTQLSRQINVQAAVA